MLGVEKNIERLIGSDSITIMNLVIPKPDIPLDIARNYKQVKGHYFLIVIRNADYYKHNVLYVTLQLI